MFFTQHQHTVMSMWCSHPWSKSVSGQQGPRPSTLHINCIAVNRLLWKSWDGAAWGELPDGTTSHEIHDTRTPITIHMWTVLRPRQLGEAHDLALDRRIFLAWRSASRSQAS